MQKWILGLVVFLEIAWCAMAQGPYSLQVGETAAPEKQGALHTTAGINIGPDTLYGGVRGAVALLDGLLVFGDAGWVNVDGWDGGPSFQAGAMFSLPIPPPVDVAIRGTLYKPLIDSDVSITGVTLGGVVSRDLETVVPGLSVYGYMGLDLSSSSVEVDTWLGHSEVTEDNVYLALAAGATYRFADRLSLYGEISYVDDPFIGGGVRLNF